MSCRHHRTSNITIPLEAALEQHDTTLCRGITKADTLCKIKAQICKHHRPDRILTEGDIFRDHLSTLTHTREKEVILHFQTRCGDPA